MNWIRNKSWLVLTAMFLLAATTIVLAGGQVAAPDPWLPGYTAHLSPGHFGHDNAGPGVDPHHGNAPADGAHTAGMVGGLPCNAACPVGSSGCVPGPLVSHADSFVQRGAGTIRMRPGDDLMLSGVSPSARPKPPKPIA